MPLPDPVFYNAACTALLRGKIAFDSTPLTAVLLAPTYAPDLINHSIFSDIASFEAHSKPRALLTGARVENAGFISDAINFGDPVTTGPVRYAALVAGTSSSLDTENGESLLVALFDLTGGNTVYEASASAFRLVPPPSGWFTLAAA